MSLIDQYSASKLGPTIRISYVTGSSTDSALWTIVRTLSEIQPPFLWVLNASTNCYVRQSVVGNVMDAEPNSFELSANTYWPLLMESANDGVVAVRAITTNGILKLTLVNRLAPIPDGS